MIKRLKVGIFGVGSMGEKHLQKYLSMPDISVVGINDVDSERLKYISSKYNIPSCPYGDLIRKINIASIATPPESHYPIANDLLSLGVHTLLEKPMTGSSELLSSLNGLAIERGVILQPGLIERFNPIVDLIIQSTDFCLNNEAIFARSIPYDNRAKDISIIKDLGLHDLDLCLFIFGKFLQIGECKYNLTKLTPFPDFFSGKFLFNTNKCKIISMRNSKDKFVSGVIENNFLYLKFNLYKRTADIQYKDRNLNSHINYASVDPLFNELRSLICTVREHGEPKVTARDGIRVLRLIEYIESGL